MASKISEGGKEGVIYLSKEDLAHRDGVSTLRQVRQIVADPTVEHARFMPDCHPSVSCCVGTTALITPRIVPRFIGGDIGCGITTYCMKELADDVERRAEKIVPKIRAAVPMGDLNRDVPLDPSVLDVVGGRAREIAREFHRRYPDIATLPPPAYDAEWIDGLKLRSKVPGDALLRQMGTLGGGNHFVEVGRDSQGHAWATVHSGSRRLGQGILHHYQGMITEGRKKDYDAFEAAVKKMKRNVKDKKQRKIEEDKLCELHMKPKGLPYLEGEPACMYCYDMVFAQCYAQVSREIMLGEVVKLSGRLDADPADMIHTTHNYMDFEDGVWRKGAVRADKDQLFMIALNMRDGMVLARGKGNPEWNNSAPHGAGRRAARGEARHRTTLKEFREAMEGIASDSVVAETLDESPAMYKDHEEILERSAPACDVVERIIPLLNLKGTFA